MIISISFLSLIITNYLVVNKLRTYKKELIEEKGKLYATSELEHTYWVNFLQGIHTDGTKFDNVKLASKEQPPIALEEYMKDIPYVLLVRISDMHCNDCVTSIMSKLNRLSSELNLTANTLVLASYQNPVALKSVRNLAPALKTCSVNSTDISFPLEEANFPYCLVLTKDMTVLHSFTPNKAVHHLTDSYLKNISQRYFQTN
ncbi:heavy-metal-associated domain-containing protein [Bacteroides acidifaciens]|nr:heavy-metal-associated domain-containing protein [Bacteroides acidifaciens]